MEFQEEVEEVFGKSNLTLLLEECKNGKIDKQTMKDMAKKMHGHVHGEFVQRTSYTDVTQLKLANVMRYMLDVWYNQELHKPGVNGLEKLKNILDDVGLSPLALKMK